MRLLFKTILIFSCFACTSKLKKNSRNIASIQLRDVDTESYLNSLVKSSLEESSLIFIIEDFLEPGVKCFISKFHEKLLNNEASVVNLIILSVGFIENINVIESMYRISSELSKVNFKVLLPMEGRFTNDSIFNNVVMDVADKKITQQDIDQVVEEHRGLVYRLNQESCED